MQLFFHNLGGSTAPFNADYDGTKRFRKNDFKRYFSQSQILNCLMRFFCSGMGPWAQISCEGTIFDAEHDDRTKFPIFEHFGKSRNKV